MNEPAGNWTTQLAPLGEETLPSGLTRTEVVVIGAVGAVVVLAVLAVFLRIVMPRIRQKYAKERTVPARPIIEVKNGNLLAPPTPSSGSSRSSSTRSSYRGDWSDASSYKTKSTYYSQNSLYPGKQSSFGNLRQQPGHHSGNASPASYRSKTTERLSEDLLSMISQQSNALEPLKLGEQYRSNWETSNHVLDTQQGYINSGYTSPASDLAADIYDTYPFRYNTNRPWTQDSLQVPTVVYPAQTRL